MITEENQVNITKEEYNYLVDELKKLRGEVGEISNNVDDVKTSIRIMEPQLTNVSNIVTGNGTPDTGLSTRLKLLETAWAAHLLLHKENQARAWDITKPILARFIELIVTAGIVLGATQLIK